MADQADIETALAALAADALYPQGTGAPSAPGPLCRVYRGWPVPAALEADLAAGQVHVAVSALAGSLRPAPGFAGTWNETAAPAPLLAATTAGENVIFSGPADAGQIAGVLADGRAYAYRTEAGDTPEMVAARLAALITRDRVALVAGPVLSVPGAARLVARVLADRPALRETRRQTQGFRLACFCPDPATRDAVAAAIDAAFAARRFLALPDGSAARLLFAGGASLDDAQQAGLYRRDLLYAAEYATTESETQVAMLFGTGSVGAISYVN